MKNLKHIEIFENYQLEDFVQNREGSETEAFFTTETSMIKPTDPATSEGNYIITFNNSEGQETTLEIAGASSPKYTEGAMTSYIDVIEGSSSDGKKYSTSGHYVEIPDSLGQYELKKVIVEEI